MQDRQLTLTRLIQASPDKVWRCWTDPSLIAQWFGPEGFRCTTKQIDLRAGGLWRFDMTGPDGTVWPNRHRITLYAPISRIEFLMDADSDDQPPMQVVVTLERCKARSRPWALARMTWAVKRMTSWPGWRNPLPWHDCPPKGKLKCPNCVSKRS